MIKSLIPYFCPLTSLSSLALRPPSRSATAQSLRPRPKARAASNGAVRMKSAPSAPRGPATEPKKSMYRSYIDL